jgi:ABC-type oligopeptide transport system ATPase subunit
VFYSPVNPGRFKVAEQGRTDEVFDNPASDYAKMLLAALPVPDPRKSPYRYPSTAQRT